MAVRIGSCYLPCVSTSPHRPKLFSRSNLSQRLHDRQLGGIQQQIGVTKCRCSVTAAHLVQQGVTLKRRFAGKQHVCFATNDYQSEGADLESNALEHDIQGPFLKDTSSVSSSYVCYEGNEGKPGLVSFYSRPSKIEGKVVISSPEGRQTNFVWFIGPALLVASFIFPSLYLRRILSSVFEDSLLTDFLILFFTEAIFYCGVAVFLLMIDRQRRPVKLDTFAIGNRSMAPQLGFRISSVAVLVLSLMIPMVTMGLVWPWTGPTASATLAPYLVGIVVQFAFEQYATRKKSPAWPVIPVIFHVYRLHQLNRAAQLVTALSLTLRGAEMTPHRLAINSSLATLSTVLQCLGVICIWSLSSFLMRFFPSTAINAR